ncbi:MAG TPA: type II secretion system protein [Pyrinomonadaceae bacterium]
MIDPITSARGGAHGAGARASERGYALVALLAMMSIMMLLILASAPSIRQQTQREREIEAIFRGEEVAEAIRRYVQANNGQLPTSMDQLLEGIPRGTKKVQILRPAAAIDPLSESGEWRMIRVNDAALVKFQVAVTLYAGGKTPVSRDPFIQKYTPRAIQSITNLGSNDDSTPSQQTKDDATQNENKEGAPPSESDESSSSEDTSVNSTGPFIGVASRNSSPSIITYYGIERHDRWIFTPLFR